MIGLASKGETDGETFIFLKTETIPNKEKKSCGGEPKQKSTERKGEGERPCRARGRLQR